MLMKVNEKLQIDFQIKSLYTQEHFSFWNRQGIR